MMRCPTARMLSRTSIESLVCALAMAHYTSGWGRLQSGELLEQHLRGLGRRCRVLAGDQETIANHVRAPVRTLRIQAALGLEFVFDQEGHDLGQADAFFFG